MPHLDDIERLGVAFPDASRKELWKYLPAGGNINSAVIAMLEDGFVFRPRPRSTNEGEGKVEEGADGDGSPEAKKRRQGTAPREDEDEGTAPPTPPGAGDDSTAVAPSDGNILSPLVDSMSLLGAAPAPPALDAAADAAEDVSEVAVEPAPAAEDVSVVAVEPAPAAEDVSEVAVEPAPAAEDVSVVAVEPAPAAEAKAAVIEPLPDYVLGEITDPQDSDEQWHEGRSQGADYVFYQGLVSSKKSEFDDAVHLDHQKGSVSNHWLVNEEKFTEFLAKHHKREPGYEIAKEALAQHQGRFYIVRNGKRYEVSKTHPQVLHKAYKTLCAIKMSHALPDYVLGEITDPQDSDEQWHEEGGGSRSQGAGYVYYHGLVSSKKSEFDDAVHLDHQKRNIEKHWLVNEEKFTEFLAKHHKREPGYEIAKEALAQHQGRFYIVRNGKRYEVSKTHPQVLHKAFSTLCAIKMSHEERTQLEEREIIDYVRAVASGEDPPLADQKHGNTRVVNKKRSDSAMEREESLRDRGILTWPAAHAASWESKTRFIEVIWNLAKKDKFDFIKFSTRKDILEIFARFLEDGDTTADDISDMENKDKRYFGVIISDVISLAAALKKEPKDAVNQIKNYMKAAKCNPGVMFRAGSGYTSEDVFIFHMPEMERSKKGKNAVGETKIAYKKVFK
eukprot:scaffold973_cov115-Skeletonema_dohrnii-CCMP3373.AAC.7